MGQVAPLRLSTSTFRPAVGEPFISPGAPQMAIPSHPHSRSTLRSDSPSYWTFREKHTPPPVSRSSPRTQSLCLRPKRSPSVDFWGFLVSPLHPRLFGDKTSHEPLSWSPPSTVQHPEFSRLFPACCLCGDPGQPPGRAGAACAAVIVPVPLRLSLTGRARFLDSPSPPPPPSGTTQPLASLSHTHVPCPPYRVWALTSARGSPGQKSAPCVSL